MNLDITTIKLNTQGRLDANYSDHYGAEWLVSVFPSLCAMVTKPTIPITSIMPS